MLLEFFLLATTPKLRYWPIISTPKVQRGPLSNMEHHFSVSERIQNYRLIALW